MRSTWASSETSVGTDSALPPIDWISSTARSPDSALMSATTTHAPSRGESVRNGEADAVAGAGYDRDSIGEAHGSSLTPFQMGLLPLLSPPAVRVDDDLAVDNHRDAVDIHLLHPALHLQRVAGIDGEVRVLARLDAANPLGHARDLRPIDGQHGHDVSRGQVGVADQQGAVDAQLLDAAIRMVRLERDLHARVVQDGRAVRAAVREHLVPPQARSWDHRRPAPRAARAHPQ